MFSCSTPGVLNTNYGESVGTWKPIPQNQPYYDKLFMTADMSRANSISGKEAVEFFSRSKLPNEILRHVWQLSDRKGTSTLDREDFAYACRLICLAQNNVTIGPGSVENSEGFQGVPIFEVSSPSILLSHSFN